jgi:hypothetical protein
MSDTLERELLALGSSWRDGVPEALRKRVIAIPHSAGDAVPNAKAASRWSVRRHPVAAGIAAAATIGLLLAIPGARLAIARQGVRVLQALRIAPHTQLQTDDVQTTREVSASARQLERQLSTGRAWHVSTPYIGFGGSVPNGASPDVRRIDQPAVLLSLALMPLIGPEGEYRGEPIAFHHAWLAPDGLVLAFFGYGETELLLVQAPVRNGQQMAYSRSVSGQGDTVIGVAPSIEILTVNGQRLTWDPDTTGIMPNSSALRWEHSGVSYSLYGRVLTRDEALALFSSLRPLQ